MPSPLAGEGGSTPSGREGEDGAYSSREDRHGKSGGMPLRRAQGDLRQGEPGIRLCLPLQGLPAPPPARSSMSGSRWLRDPGADRGREQDLRAHGRWRVRDPLSFLSNCGSNVYWEGDRAPDYYGITVGSFADPGFPAPSLSVWGGGDAPVAGPAARNRSFCCKAYRRRPGKSLTI